MTALAALSLLAAVVQTPATGPEGLRAIARDGPESTLVARVRAQPDDMRDALRQLLADAVSRSSDSASTASLTTAGRLASAYAIAWRDSFFVRQIARFRSWLPDERRTKVRGDSLRLAGNAALGRSGVAAAQQLWRESVRQCATIADTAGMAAALGNIGRSFWEQDQLDSAETYFASSLTLAERVGDLRTAGNAVGNLASVNKDRGELRRAESLYVRAGEIRRKSGDERGLAADENNRGLIAQMLGDLPAARHAFETALAANRHAERLEPAAINLVNLGNLASLTGDYVPAETRYREALALYRQDENRPGAASVWHDIGLLKLSRGDYTGALAALNASVGILDVTGPGSEAAAVRRDLAEVRAALGDLQGALRELRRAENSAARDGSDDVLGWLALARADLAVLFNQPANAEREYGRAIELYRRAGDAAGQADALQGQALLSIERRDYKQAQHILQLALRAQATTADRRGAALTRLLMSFALREDGDTAAARETVTLALDSLRGIGDVVGEAAALQQFGDLATDRRLTFTAESLYRHGLERLGTVSAPSVSWLLHAGLSEALRSRGALSAAAEELRAAAADVERVANRLPLEQHRAAYLADKWDVYAQLALLERARGQTEAAFEASEQLRARQMLDLLARGRVAWPETGGDSLARREQDLRLQISDLTRRLEDTQRASADLREPGTGAAAAVREALAAAQAAYADLLGEMQESKPEYARLVRGQVTPLRDVARRLARDEALLEYLVTDSTTVVFVVTSDTAAALDLGIGRHALAALVDFTRAAVAKPVRAAVRPQWQAPLERLYSYLIDPIETAGLLRGKHALLIAPHAELHYLPFAALQRAGPPREFLVERYLVTSVPSASVWVRLHERSSSDAGSNASVLVLAPRVDVLPGTRGEAAAIGRIFGGRARALIGPAATKRAFRAEAPGRGIIHLATFGVLNKHNPLFSFVELAPQPGTDGRLEVHEVFALDLHARLVVLSACQTALGSGALADVPTGDDWTGLVQAFLQAGASNVLATLWPVEDRATAVLMERFYGAIATGSAEAEALANAQRLALRNPGTADPFYWAGFTLSGGR